MAMLDFVRCPKCLGPLIPVGAPKEGVACNACGYTGIEKGIECSGARVPLLQLVFPADCSSFGVGEDEAEKAYASQYDELVEWSVETYFDGDMRVGGLPPFNYVGVAPGNRVLDVACGGGHFVAFALERVGANGFVAGLDLSPHMLAKTADKVAKNHNGKSCVLVQGNGEFLPFANGSFDVTHHMGWVNGFDARGQKRFFSELARVTKVGGVVVVSDEGVAPWLRGTAYAHDVGLTSRDPRGAVGDDRSSIRSFFHFEPPIEMIPENATEVSVSWVAPSNSFYFIKFRVGASTPNLCLTERLPAPRTDTLGDALAGKCDLWVSVCDEAGRPLPDAEVSAVPVGWQLMWMFVGTEVVRTNARGEARIESLLKGRYKIRASASGAVAESDAFEHGAGPKQPEIRRITVRVNR
jgi:SAM-dependent methyltransferase